MLTTDVIWKSLYPSIWGASVLPLAGIEKWTRPWVINEHENKGLGSENPTDLPRGIIRPYLRRIIQFDPMGIRVFKTWKDFSGTSEKDLEDEPCRYSSMTSESGKAEISTRHSARHFSCTSTSFTGFSLKVFIREKRNQTKWKIGRWPRIEITLEDISGSPSSVPAEENERVVEPSIAIRRPSPPILAIPFLPWEV